MVLSNAQCGATPFASLKSATTLRFLGPALGTWWSPSCTPTHLSLANGSSRTVRHIYGSIVLLRQSSSGWSDPLGPRRQILGSKGNQKLKYRFVSFSDTAVALVSLSHFLFVPIPYAGSLTFRQTDQRCSAAVLQFCYKTCVTFGNIFWTLRLRLQQSPDSVNDFPPFNNLSWIWISWRTNMVGASSLTTAWRALWTEGRP